MNLKFDANLKPHELPTLWGSPAVPDLPMRVRLVYALGFIIALIAASLQNNLIIAYIQYLEGDYGMSRTEGGVITAAYYMGNVWMTIMLFKLRQHFGLKIFFAIIFSGLVSSQLLELFYKDFYVVLFARFINGVVGSGLAIRAIFCALEMLGASKRHLMFPASIGMLQIGSALSRYIVAYFSINDTPHLMICFELGISLLALSTFLLIELPPSRYGKSIYWEDSCIIFYAIATAICCLIFSIGNIVWWNHDYIPYSLCVALVCFGIFFCCEFLRKNPFLLVNFLKNLQLIELAFAAAFVRMCLAEQTTGATLLFKDVLGFSDYQLMSYYGVLTLGALCGGIACLCVFQYPRSHGMILFASILIPLGSFLNVRLSSQIMPEDLYLGQFLIAFASVYIIGPLMVNGIVLGLARGVHFIMTFAAIFIFSQAVFGLLGSAIIGYFIRIQTSQHAQDLINHTPDVYNPDSHFYDEVMKQAGVLAYSDLFLYIGVIGSAVSIFLALRYIYFKIKRKNPIGRELKILKTRSMNAMAKTQRLEKGENNATN